MQTNLDIWRARDLTLFGKVMIIKSLGLSQLIYSASVLNIREGLTPIGKAKLFNKIKRAGLYQDLDKGGIRMIDIEIIVKALKLAWISRPLSFGRQK